MGRFAPIAPLAIQQHLDLERDSFGDYHLLLANVVLSDPKGWSEYYEKKRRRVSEGEGEKQGLIVILDNSLIELGKAMDSTTLNEAIHIVGPDYLVLPDVMGDMYATMAASMDFVDGADPATWGMCEPLGVAQGEDIRQLVQCAQFMLEELCCGAISIPRVVADKLGTRFDAVQQIARMCRDSSAGLHLLGFSSNLSDDIRCARHPSVMGIDSAYPVWCGHEIKSTNAYDRKARRPADFWTWDIDKINVDQVESNIRRVRMMVR